MPHYYNPHQPRVPAGRHEGGQWSRDGSGRQHLAKPAVPDRRRRETFGQNDPIVRAPFSRPANPEAGKSPILPSTYTAAAEAKNLTKPTPVASSRYSFGYDDPIVQLGSPPEPSVSSATDRLAQTEAPQQSHDTLSRLRDLFLPQVCRPTPTNFFPVGRCLDACATASPDYMELFCRMYTQEGTKNRSLCWQAVQDLRAEDIESCKNRCRAIANNW